MKKNSKYFRFHGSLESQRFPTPVLDGYIKYGGCFFLLQSWCYNGYLILAKNTIICVSFPLDSQNIHAYINTTSDVH